MKALLIILGGLAWLAFAPAASAAGADGTPHIVQVIGDEPDARFLPLGVGKSVIIELPRDAKDVLVADPKIANAIVRTARRAYLIGVAVGQTNVFFLDGDGRQIAGFDIAVTRDLNGARAALKQLLPNADLRIEGVADGLLISGTVSSADQAQQAFNLAGRLAGDNSKVVNAITISGRDQVMLKVSVAEVQRDVIKQLGVDLNGSLGYGAAVVNFNTNNPFTASGLTGNGSALTGTWKSINATLRAMERAGVIRTLAEPSLTAISGESASFLVGGEFPVPGGLSCDATTRACQVSVQFKQFGVALSFTPVVLAEGRISLRVVTEVSELSTEGALLLQQQGSSVQIPSLRTRRADTTVEIPSGGALAMAGMIQEQTKQQINGIPGLMQVPVLGTLFKSRDYINRQTELMILVTPYVVRAVSQKQLSRPDDGFADASDPASILIGRLHRIYGVAGKAEPKRAYHGKHGFILD